MVYRPITIYHLSNKKKNEQCLKIAQADLLERIVGAI